MLGFYFIVDDYISLALLWKNYLSHISTWYGMSQVEIVPVSCELSQHKLRARMGQGRFWALLAGWGLLQGLPNAKTALNLPRRWEVLQDGKNYTMELHSPS